VFVVCLVVRSTSAIDCLERRPSVMSCYVSSAMLNSTHLHCYWTKQYY